MELAHWRIEWSSSTGSGNIFYQTPANWSRARVIRAWETSNYGCYVDRLFGVGVKADE